LLKNRHDDISKHFFVKPRRPLDASEFNFIAGMFERRIPKKNWGVPPRGFAPDEFSNFDSCPQ